MTQKFRILHKAIETKPANATLIVKAVCVLHNTIIDKEGIDYSMTDENPQNTMDAILNREFTHSRQIAQNTRNKFKDYFMSEQGSVPWQNFIR